MIKLSIYVAAVGLAGVLVLGFLAGLFTFRAKSRWCDVCGASLTCLDCHNRNHVRTRSRNQD